MNHLGSIILILFCFIVTIALLYFITMMIMKRQRIIKRINTLEYCVNITVFFLCARRYEDGGYKLESREKENYINMLQKIKDDYNSLIFKSYYLKKQIGYVESMLNNFFNDFF